MVCSTSLELGVDFEAVDQVYSSVRREGSAVRFSGSDEVDTASTASRAGHWYRSAFPTWWSALRCARR